jgi:hypothetical protein
VLVVWGCRSSPPLITSADGGVGDGRETGDGELTDSGVADNSIEVGERDAELESGNDSDVICHCPFGGTALKLPANLPAAIANASGDSCSVSYASDEPFVGVTATQPTTCLVRVVLTNGLVLTATVVFSRNDKSCCPHLVVAVSQSMFEYSDGGLE